MKRSGFEIQRAAIFALFLREIRTRFGAYRLGYMWALLEPAAHVVVLTAVTSSIGVRVIPGISFPAFFIAGVVPWFLFSDIAVRSLKAVDANAGLFNYRPVKPIDTIIARALLEFVISACVYLLLLTLVDLFYEPIELDSLLLLLASFILLAWFSFGVGLCLMALGDAFPEAEKIVPLAIRPLYFVSGIFFSLELVPSDYHAYLLWNPLLHAIEVGRSALSYGYDVPDASLLYLFLVALAANVLGLLVYHAREREMLST